MKKTIVVSLLSLLPLTSFAGAGGFNLSCYDKTGKIAIEVGKTPDGDYAKVTGFSKGSQKADFTSRNEQMSVTFLKDEAGGTISAVAIGSRNHFLQIVASVKTVKKCDDCMNGVIEYYGRSSALALASESYITKAGLQCKFE
jgi:hypothetical protein